MTEDEAIAEAERAAEQAGYRLDAYDEAEVKNDDHGWRVFYQMKHPAPVGGHFAVYVEESGATRLVPGM